MLKFQSVPHHERVYGVNLYFHSIYIVPDGFTVLINPQNLHFLGLHRLVIISTMIPYPDSMMRELTGCSTNSRRKILLFDAQ